MPPGYAPSGPAAAPGYLGLTWDPQIGGYDSGSSSGLSDAPPAAPEAQDHREALQTAMIQNLTAWTNLHAIHGTGTRELQDTYDSAASSPR